MTEDEYRRSVGQKGYDVPIAKEWTAGHFNDWHIHPFWLYVHVQAGEMTLELERERGVETVVCGPGDNIEVPAGMRHTERITGADTRFLSAPRHVPRSE